MTFPENLKQRGVRHRRRVKDDLNHFVVGGLATAYLIILGVLGVAGLISDRCAVYSVNFPENSFSAPEAAHTE